MRHFYLLSAIVASLLFPVAAGAAPDGSKDGIILQNNEGGSNGIILQNNNGDNSGIILQNNDGGNNGIIPQHDADGKKLPPVPPIRDKGGVNSSGKLQPPGPPIKNTDGTGTGTGGNDSGIILQGNAGGQGDLPPVPPIKGIKKGRHITHDKGQIAPGPPVKQVTGADNDNSDNARDAVGGGPDPDLGIGADVGGGVR
jgi:hypothetical protein